MLPPFAPKQTFARIDYLQQGGRLVGKKTLIRLKFLLKTRQNNDYAIYKHIGIGIVSTNVYDRQPVWLQGMLPTAIMAASCKRRNSLSATAGFQLVDNISSPNRLLYCISKRLVVFHSFLSPFSCACRHLTSLILLT